MSWTAISTPLLSPICSRHNVVPFLRKTLSVAFKIAVSGSLLYILFTKIPISTVGGALRDARPSYLFLGWLCFMGIMLACSVRWMTLTAHLGFPQGFYDLTLYMFAGSFFNLFLPTSLGGDVGRAYYLARGADIPPDAPGAGTGLRRAFITVLIDRGMGLVALLFIASAALSLYPSHTLPLPPSFKHLTVSATALVTVLGIIPFFLGGMIGGLGRAFDEFVSYWKRPDVLTRVLVLSLAIQLCDVVINITVGYSLDLNVPLLYYFVLTPLILVASMFPSLAGLGVREGAYVYLLSAVGVPEAKAMAVALGWLFIMATSSIIGAFILVTGILNVPWEYGRDRTKEKEA